MRGSQRIPPGRGWREKTLGVHAGRVHPGQVSADSMDKPRQDDAPRVRHAVVIAAGSGTRFGNLVDSTPKPLMKVAGVPLIERTLLTAQKAGIHRFTVVTGYRAEVLEAFLHQAALPGIEVECIRNEAWQRANGLSALKARGKVRGQFLLLMADHLFEEGIIRKVMSKPLAPGRCRLAVDFQPAKNIDLNDATKVHVVGDQVRAIGKGIKTYNAIDTGIFFCSEALFDALAEAISRGEESLSDGIREMARNRRMEAVDIGDGFWQDVDNERDLKEGEKQLLHTLVGQNDSWLTRLINRRISLAVTHCLASTRIKATQITLLTFGVGLLGVAVMLWGTYAGFVVGVALFLLSTILARCSGEIARLKFQDSRLGAYLDRVPGKVKHMAVFALMTLGLIRASGSHLYLLPASLLLLSALSWFLMRILAPRRIGRAKNLLVSQKGVDVSSNDQRH
jgi:choline kinase/phosphatidylglycerophosphate synthase